MAYQASSHHSFDIKLATELKSIELAIIVHHFQYWINKNQQLGINFIDGRTWTYQTREEISAHFNYFTPDQVRRYTDKLVTLKILRKGNFNKLALDKTIWYAFENEEMFTIGRIANSTGNFANSTGNFAKAIPKSIPKSLPRYNKDLGNENEVLEKPKEKTVDISKRWALTEQQHENFLVVKALGITDSEANLINDGKIAFWVKKFSLTRILDVYNEGKHYNARSLKAYMSKLLDENKVVSNNNTQANIEYARDFMKEKNWHTPKIYKNYMKIQIGEDSQEIDFNMNFMDFVNRLYEKYELTQQRYN